MAQKVAKASIKREAGYLYFIDKNGNISSVQMARAGVKTSKKKICACSSFPEKQGLN